MADRTILFWRIVAGVVPAALRSAIHSRTWLGRLSTVRIGPKVGLWCLSIE